VSQNPDPLKFRLSFIILPLAVMVIAAGIAGFFFGQLPAEIHYRFGLDGAPSGDPVSKNGFIGLMLAIQIGLTGLAYLSVRAIGRVQLFQDNVHNFWFNPTKLLTAMGNMPAIIQTVVAYILIDGIFYALNDSHLMPLWLFALITLVLGGIILIIYALPVVLQTYRGFDSFQDKKKE
jgi:hypothetical protein